MRRSAIALAIACATVLVSASTAVAASGSPKDPDAKRFVDGVRSTASCATRSPCSRSRPSTATRGLDELSDAASYAVWYFSSVRDPFGTRGHGKGANALRGAKGHTFQGSHRLTR